VLPPLPELLSGEITDERYAEAVSEWDDLDPQEQAIACGQIVYLERLARAFALLSNDECDYWPARFEQIAAQHDEHYAAEGDRR
jgi:hypothetical protein